MPKITIVLHDLRGGGAEKMMVSLANQFVKDGIKTDLILIGEGGANQQFLDPSVRLIALNCSRTLNAIIPLRRALKRSNPDGVLSALTHVNVISILACLSLNRLARLSVSERNAYSLDRLVNKSLVMKSVYAIAPFLYRLLPNPVIAVSQGVANDLVNTTVVKIKNVVTAQNPVITDATLKNATKAPQHPWLIDKSKPTLITAGRLSHQKGFDLLLEAFFQVRKTKDYRLVIFGEGELKTALMQQAESLGISQDVDFPGYSDNILAEMAAADLYVLSSRFEGSPNSLVEAMSTNTAVVAFDCPHGPSEILQGGAIAPLIPLGDVQSLAQSILGSIGQTVCYKNICQRYYASQSSRQYQALIMRNNDTTGESL